MFATAFGLSLLTRDNTSKTTIDEAGASVYSSSALGHLAFAAFLSNLGIPQGRAFSNARDEAGDDGLVVLAEPWADANSLAYVQNTLRTGKSLLILPKFRGHTDPSRPRWVAGAELVEEEAVQGVLRLVDDKATLVRTGQPKSWTRNDFTVLPTSSTPQFIRSDALTPIMATADGILIGEMQLGDSRIVVLADPELVTNRGLARGDNAFLVAQLVDRARAGQGRVVFDEGVHGGTLTQPHPAKWLFAFPRILFVLQLLAVAGLFIWSAAAYRSHRSGPPAAPQGLEALLRSTARLLGHPSHIAMLTDRYVEHTVREVAARMHISHAGARALLGAFAGGANGVSQAEDVFRWKREVFHGRGRRR